MWKFSIICSFMAIFTGIALNLISNSIHDKRKQLSELEKRIEQKIEKLKTEWEFHTQPDKLMQIAEDKLGMSTKEVEQFAKIEIVKLRSSAWKLDLGVTKENLLKDIDYKKVRN